MNPTKSYKVLVKNIKALNLMEDAVPCDLLVSGDSAFPVLVNPKGQVLIAASQYGKGRLVVLAHENYLVNPSFTQLIENAIEWLKPSADSPVGVNEQFHPLIKVLSDKGHRAEPTRNFQGHFGVYCTHAYDDKQSDQLIMALKEGNGLLIAGQAWNWASKNAGKNVALDFPGNQVTSVTGIHFLSDYGKKGVYFVTPEMPISSLMTRYKWDLLKDLKQLLHGVTKLSLSESGTPSHLIVHGERAFPLIVDGSHKTFIAAAYYGKGRVVVATHENYIGYPDDKKLVNNLVSWLGDGREGIIGIHHELSGMQKVLDQASERQMSDFKSSFSVYCCKSYSDKHAQNILEFVAEGGGLLIAGHAWHWASNSPLKDAITDYPGNNIINQFGISILGESSSLANLRTINMEDPSKTYQFRKALDQLKVMLDTDQKINEPVASWLWKLAYDCLKLLNAREQDKQTFHTIKGVILNLLLKHGIPKVLPGKPVKRGSKEAFLLRIATGLNNTLPKFKEIVTTWIPEDDLHVSPPQKLMVNCSTKAYTWRSTGLFVPPGKTAAVIFPESAVNKGLQVQIGCHSDDISHAPEMARPPVVVQRYSIDKAILPVSNVFGGLIYITVPRGCTVGNIEICVEGAVLAPYYKHGETSDSSWEETICHFPAPWAELEATNIILTVPSSSVRTVKKMSDVLAAWDRIMEGILQLSALPPVLERKERIVSDIQISAGLMHSGYPIMCHLPSVEAMLDFKNIKNLMWGFIHELGHNQQLQKFDIPPHTTDATCNLWSVYVYENVLAIPREKAHSDLQPHVRIGRLKRHLGEGAPLHKWNVWVCLETYLQLQEAFGWEPFIQLFSDSRKMGNISEDKTFKMNLWAELFSQKVQRNLVPFFKAWGWPIKEDLAKKLSSLPEWKENPMLAYMG